MKNFFNAIGVADMEKVHSAMIAWILDDANDNNSLDGNFKTFPLKQRSMLLCKMFGLNEIEFKTIHTYVEWKDIDIMIKTTDSCDKEEIWVIENKLKSQEHMSKINEETKDKQSKRIWQTEKYVRVVNADEQYKDKIQHYMLLSLGGDKAKCSDDHHKWSSYTYKQLVEVLDIIFQAESDSYPLIEEYKNSIKDLVLKLKTFLDRPADFRHVFQTKMTKDQKVKSLATNNNLDENEHYIIENGLETIFQKQWLKKMVSIAVDLKKDEALLKKLYDNMVIDEDRGIAEFDYTIATLDEKERNKDGDLELQVQFQNGTFKVVVIHKDYRNPKNPVDYRRMIDEGVWKSRFENFEKKGGEWSLQKAKGKDNQKARIALTKKNEKEWYKYKSGEGTEVINWFINGFIESYNIAKNIAQLN